MFDFVQVNDITMTRDSMGAYVTATIRFRVKEAAPEEGSPIIEVRVSQPLEDDEGSSLGDLRSALLDRALGVLKFAVDADPSDIHALLGKPLDFDVPR